MRLRVITPSGTCVDRSVRRIRAEAPDGHFGMLPHHIDFVTQLVPGVLVYETPDGVERYVAVNSGTLVKCAQEVTVAVRGALTGDHLAELRTRVDTEFRRQDEAEREARSALARIEASMMRRFRDLELAGR
ncbi:F0F1 ATP synthase subunit epsilon [Sulfitobacter sabulilitoris]|uniref:ATP synthase epsilon chain n=1 Tax=Sulfitobacter sabulilitoris TaxID=2562655 RepID=A0A5S3PNV7_9RHOB|nr:F0F1 ATP synthase subunit epsilon [Sulfitobacter sabulilitoris]TMM54195.1 F0F1 ATP synthase subunit epsilon [Sulfitobacter sabulilitoris]